MRKVSKDIAKAFLINKRMSIGNTSTDGNAIYLHGNRIAERREDGVYVTLAGWPTVTTRERLNTLLNYLNSGISVRQHKHATQWLNLPIGMELDYPDTDWVKVA